MAILSLGDEKLRAGCEVNDAIPAGTPCKCDAAGKDACEDPVTEVEPLGWPSPCVLASPRPALPALVDVDAVHSVSTEGRLG